MRFLICIQVLALLFPLQGVSADNGLAVGAGILQGWSNQIEADKAHQQKLELMRLEHELRLQEYKQQLEMERQYRQQQSMQQLQQGRGAGISSNSEEMKADKRARQIEANRANNPEEQVNLALKYFFGDGVKQSYAEAARLFAKAAKKNNPVAIANLGGMYLNGQGVKQDYSQAFKLFKQIADKKIARNIIPSDEHLNGSIIAARTQLGVMYANGLGIPVDYPKAHMWLNLASEGGESRTYDNMALLEKEMTTEQIEEGNRLFKEWKLR